MVSWVLDAHGLNNQQCIIMFLKHKRFGRHGMLPAREGARVVADLPADCKGLSTTNRKGNC